MSEIIFLEVEDLIAINKKVVKDYGGSIGVRDKGLLESACHSPQNLYFYQNVDLFEMAAGYAFAIIQNHPFLDGNKRTGFAAIGIFLSQNNIKIDFINIDKSVEMMVNIATKKVKFEQVVKWLKSIKK